MAEPLLQRSGGAVLMLSNKQGASGDLRLMDVQPYNTLVRCYQFHTTSFVATVDKGRAVGGAAEDA
ncbi:hypothetical protein PY257_06890 [Ramlibacter sp. H39-3-26]|uniref:hypothetical protein n=1 Tax=Curvibacter soli TaxID=3031331 RepID=UPI0023DAE2ED|nr:hypothetical protein [Ramlibacter sp. H39-3-26]MDF1484913.1 hypothetical protein [Ramlibacter sp. H39-3-26]